jgi:hypothetical protein
MHQNPYAWAITPSQIAQRWDCTEAEIILQVDDERKLFDMFCQMKARQGIFYSSQLEAWRNWNDQYPAEPHPLLTSRFYPDGIPEPETEEMKFNKGLSWYD